MLVQSGDPSDFEHALTVINNWRSSHPRPLQITKMTLLNRARAVYEHALIAQRIRRIPAINLKLMTNPNMQLSKMHDIGGCRAVLRTVLEVENLVNVYEKATNKNARRGGEFIKKYDYISQPKCSGYRGIHLAYKYRTDSKKLAAWSGLRIEIQIRSTVQHAWATAVETVDAFTAQALKSNMGQDSWKRFFALVASAFASTEKKPLVPDTPTDMTELKRELKGFSRELTLLEGFQKATEVIQNKNGHIFLVKLDSEKRLVNTRGYQQELMLNAQNDYLELEKSIKGKPQMQAVLVSVESFKALKKAYPNYFLDITVFVGLLKKWIN